MDEPREFEIKLSVNPQEAKGVHSLPMLAGLPSQSDHLTARYFDTSEQMLARHGLSPRVRSNGKQKIQTLKAADAGGIVDRGE